MSAPVVFPKRKAAASDMQLAATWVYATKKIPTENENSEFKIGLFSCLHSVFEFYFWVSRFSKRGRS